MIGLYPIMCCGAAPSWDLRGRCPDDYLVRMRDLDTGALEESDSKLFRVPSRTMLELIVARSPAG